MNGYCIGGCTIIGEHTSSCIGIARKAGKVIECPGCLPQPVERGLLCWSCCAKVDELWEVLPDLVPHLRSIERGPIPDGMRTHAAAGSRVIIPVSWLTADDLWKLTHELIVFEANEEGRDAPTWRGGTTPFAFGCYDDIDTVMVNVWDAEFWLLARLQRLHEQRRTARALLRLIGGVQRALRAFPLEERAHAVEHIRCPLARGGCGMLTLEWRPPLDYLEPVTVRCKNRLCGKVYDPQRIEWDMRQLREQYEQAQEALA